MKKLIKWIITYLNIPYIFKIRKGKGCTIGSGLIVNGKRKQKITIGNNVSIGRFARIGNTTKGIFIGSNSSIGQFATVLGNVSIGENSLIASGVSFLGGNHNMNPELNQGYMAPYNDLEGDINIANNCWIGEKVIIVPGVSVGEYCIIGAGSVVTKDFPPYSLLVGNPAKVIKKYDFDTHSWVIV